MKLHLQMVGGDKLDLDIPDDTDVSDLEFKIKSGMVLSFPSDSPTKGNLNVVGKHIETWSIDPLPTTTSTTTTTAKPK